MVNRPKAIGTAAETAVVRYLITAGFPQAERRALRGTYDFGDITGTPGLVWEVKGGEAAKTASDNQVVEWLHETEREQHNANAQVGVLVVQRRQKNVSAWWAVMWADVFTWMATGITSPSLANTPVRLTLAELCPILREQGWGQPLNQQETA
jgi:hypothetical protein